MQWLERADRVVRPYKKGIHMELSMLKFNEQGLIPVITQDLQGRVLMLAYMNEESINLTLETGKAHYYSRSRQELWCKGETSGCYQYVRHIAYDCDGDTMLIRVEQVDVACHTGEYSCFYNALYASGGDIADQSILQTIYSTIINRIANPKEGSYTNYLFEKGIDKMLKKIGEESAEVIIAAKNRSKEELSNEAADLLYHLIVVLVEQGLTLKDVYEVLEKRHAR